MIPEFANRVLVFPHAECVRCSEALYKYRDGNSSKNCYYNVIRW